MSTKTGVPPALWIAPAVAKKVNGVVMTSSPGLQIQRPERQQQRIGPAGAADGVPGVREPGDFGLELRHLGPHDEPLALDDGHHGPEHLVLDAVGTAPPGPAAVRSPYACPALSGVGPEHHVESARAPASRPSTGASDSGTLGSRVT